ncbi:uncharacterized protein LOC126831829 isoform X2 [Patella vulgata]|nr:uncharacterized protein LOC126831829 isoform X2 [Patella vulgata]
MDSTDIHPDDVTLLDDRADWAGLVMDSTKSRQRIKCATCRGNQPMDGILEAVKSQAKYIYYADDVFSLHKELSKLKLNPLSYGLDFNGKNSHFDLEAHFKSGKAKSPLSQNLNSHYRLGEWRTSLIQAFVPTEMLLRPSESADEIDSRAPGIRLPKSYYHPFAQKGSLYFYEAFWAMAPIDQQYYTTWSLMTERLLEELSNDVMLNAPRKNKQQRKYGHMGVEKIARLSAMLKKWICFPGLQLFKCVELLTDELVAAQHLPKDVGELIKDFLKRLSSIGYIQPVRLLGSLSRPFIPPINKLIFWPGYTTDRSERGLNKSFKSMCNSGLGKCKEVGHQAEKYIPYYENLLLVVVFNRPGHYIVVDYLERMYRPYFPNMLYCGHDMHNFLSVYNHIDRKVTFIEVEFNKGQYGYQCVQKAIQMNYDVEGYIHLSDDVLLNVWNVQDLPKDKLWFQGNMKVANITQDVVPDIWKHPHWGPWMSDYGRVAVKRAVSVLQTLALVEQKVKVFMFMLSTNAGGQDRVYYQASDIFYIPKRFAELFAYITTTFDSNYVHFEIAVPTMLNGLDLHENIVFMNGSYLWFQDRQLYQLKYNYQHVFMHSIKLGMCIADPKCQKFICHRYLPCLYSSK